MPKRASIGIRQIKSLGVGETIWDGTVRGFGARRQKGTDITYVLFYRNHESRQRWYTIGRHGSPWTPDLARDEARRVLGLVADGEDPALDKLQRRHASTVSELCDQYLADAQAGRVLRRGGIAKKASTLFVDRGRIERHIKPLLGDLSVGSVTRTDVERLMHHVAEGRSRARIKTKPRGVAIVRGGKTAANRVIGLLGAVFTYAIRLHMRPDNPVRGVVKFADRRRERRLSDDEYVALGSALCACEGSVWPAAVEATRFLAVTGWRRSEVLELKWCELDLARRTAVLSDTKTGRSLRPLSLLACSILDRMSRETEYVFPATRGKGPMTGYRKIWLKIARQGGLQSEITPNTLRHSFASLAADLGYGDATIAGMIGHKGRTVTSRYTHAADSLLLGAVDAVAERTSALMSGKLSQIRVAATSR